MSDTTLFKSIYLKNLLSFGSGETESGQPRDAELELRPLNVFIGSNGSGKSNLIEIFRLLRALTDSREGAIENVLAKGGGMAEWVWKGPEPFGMSEIKLQLNGNSSPDLDDYYSIRFIGTQPSFIIDGERIASERPGPFGPEPIIHYDYNYGFAQPRIGRGSGVDPLEFKGLKLAKSIMPQLKGPGYPATIERVSNLLESIRIYAPVRMGPEHPARPRRHADKWGSQTHLDEDFENFAYILSRAQSDRAWKEGIREHLRKFSDRIDDFGVQINFNLVWAYVAERDFREPIPAPRLSDGTLWWIGILLILLHPNPPPLICIEEPECGLHPDMISTLAGLLKDASRTRSSRLPAGPARRHGEIF
ncbi:AAA family ATPase [Candidatus Sumerlaeota bacterium]|nr:AAA family ATPase [Candidatus Sumerlaeota bacterium]